MVEAHTFPMFTSLRSTDTSLGGVASSWTGTIVSPSTTTQFHGSSYGQSMVGADTSVFTGIVSTALFFVTSHRSQSGAGT